MGYCISQGETNFGIYAENKAAALRAIKFLAGRETHQCNNPPSFSWVQTADFMKAETLEDALYAWRWQAATDKQGSIVGLEFTGEKYGDDLMLFGAIAPYVKNGSFITMKGEDSAIFRWVFNDQKVKEKQATVKVEW